MEITSARLSILRAMEHEELRGGRTRLKDNADRSWLKRRGLIYSRPPNSNVIMRAIGGHGRVWYLTDAGRALLEATKAAEKFKEGLKTLDHKTIMAAKEAAGKDGGK